MANVPTVSWSETSPANTDIAGQGDDRIREMKTQLREVVAVDHEMESSGQDTDWGYHKAIHMIDQAGDATAVAGHGVLYAKTVDDVVELCFIDEDSRVTQLTDQGAPSLTPQSYTTGTVTVTNGSDTVTGAGTLWETNIKAGWGFFVASDDRWYTIDSVDSETQITLTENYEGTTAAGSSYTTSGLVDGVMLSAHQDAAELDHPDECVTTAKLADNAVSGQNSATASANETTTNTSYEDVDSMNVSLTTSGETGSFVEIDFNAVYEFDQNGGYLASFIFDIDDANEADTEHVLTPALGNTDRMVIFVSMRMLKTGLSAASHAFAVQWKKTGATGSGILKRRTLTVVEHKK